jgi:hypothetical protein
MLYRHEFDGHGRLTLREAQAKVKNDAAFALEFGEVVAEWADDVRREDEDAEAVDGEGFPDAPALEDPWWTAR